MLQVAIVFANVFHKIETRHEVEFLRYGPGLRVGLWIIDRDLKLQVAKVLSLEALRDMQRFGRGPAGLIEPDFSVEAPGIDNQRVAFPFTRRKPEPRWCEVVPEFATIEENLPPIIK